MRPILLFMAVMTTIGVFNMFAHPWLLTHGGSGNSSNTLIIFFIFRKQSIEAIMAGALKGG
jgi:ABC-type sugar transport system permease subunit